MKIVYASDLHGQNVLYDQLIRLVELAKPELVVLGGDLLPKGESASQLIATQRKFALVDLKKTLLRLVGASSSCVFIFGNDDCQSGIDTIDFTFSKRLFHLTNRRIKLPSGWDIIGLSCVPETPFLLKDWERRDCAEKDFVPRMQRGVRSEDDRFVPVFCKEWFDTHPSIEEILASESCDTKSPIILVAHAPPSDTSLDVLYNGTHVGSKAIRAWIEHYQPAVSFHGHIHESYVQSGRFFEKIGSTHCINAGQIHQPGLDAVIIDTNDVAASIYHTYGPETATQDGNALLSAPFHDGKVPC